MLSQTICFIVIFQNNQKKYFKNLLYWWDRTFSQLNNVRVELNIDCVLCHVGAEAAECQSDPHARSVRSLLSSCQTDPGFTLLHTSPLFVTYLVYTPSAPVHSEAVLREACLENGMVCVIKPMLKSDQNKSCGKQTKTAVERALVFISNDQFSQ